jgi:hypothetical protein
MSFANSGELVFGVVEGAEGAVEDGLAALAAEAVFEALLLVGGEGRRGVFSFQFSVFRRQRWEFRRIVREPAFDAADDLGDAALGERVVLGELLLSAALGAVGGEDGLVAGGGGAFGAGAAAVVDCCHLSFVLCQSRCGEGRRSNAHLCTVVTQKE